MRSIASRLGAQSQDAALTAVQVFNNPLVRFKSETFIVLVNIAWTYLLHAHYRQLGVEYRYYRGSGKGRCYERAADGSFKQDLTLAPGVAGDRGARVRLNAGCVRLRPYRPGAMALDPGLDDPDDLAYVTPNKPSELTALPDEQLFRLLRKVAFANQWPFDAKVQFEATARLIAALKDFKRSSDRSATVMIVLTVVLVVLTAVLVWLTIELVRAELH